MTLTEKIRDMLLKNYGGKDDIKIHPIYKYEYINIKMNRSPNYIAFRKWWNAKLQGRVLNLYDGLRNDKVFMVTIGAISKNTKDILTLKLN